LTLFLLTACSGGGTSAPTPTFTGQEALGQTAFSIYCGAEYPVALLRGFHVFAKSEPEGQNSVIPRPLAAGIGILRILPVYYIKIKSHHF